MWVNEAESIFDNLKVTSALPPDADEPEVTDTPRHQKPGRKPLSKHLPREVIRYELPAAERVCACGHALHEAGEEYSEQLEIIPAQIKVIEHVQVKYGCRACEKASSERKLC